jgi:hypothetical protein
MPFHSLLTVLVCRLPIRLCGQPIARSDIEYDLGDATFGTDGTQCSNCWNILVLIRLVWMTLDCFVV